MPKKMPRELEPQPQSQHDDPYYTEAWEPQHDDPYTEAWAKQQRERRDPLYAMEVFRVNWRFLKRPPPDWCMDFWAECFAKFLEAPEKEQSLLRILGLTGSRGKKPATKAARLRHREFQLFSKIAILNNPQFFDVSIEKAAEMACRWMEDTNPSDWKLQSTSPEAVARKYGSWSLRKEREQFTQAQMSHWSWDKNCMRTFLCQFPADLIPEKLRRTYLR